MTIDYIKRLFLAHRRELQAYLTRKIRDSEAAADLTQETFLRFTQQLQENPTSVITYERSYLYRTAHNLAVDHVRRQLRCPADEVIEEEWLAIVDEAPSPEQVVNGQDELAVARQLLAELPERTREIFLLVRVDGLTYKETALRLGISDSSVQKHLARAIKLVMQALRSGEY